MTKNAECYKAKHSNVRQIIFFKLTVRLVGLCVMLVPGLQESSANGETIDGLVRYT